MKLHRTMMLVFLAAILMSAGTALGADATATVDVNSAYVWRGITFNDGLVVQPSMDVTAGNFGFNVWGNLDVDDYDGTLDKGEFSEIDLTLTYAVQAGPVGLTAGYIEYLFPTTEDGGAEGTREVFLDASMEPVDGLSTGITGYYDCHAIQDYYLNANVGYGISFDSGLGINCGAAVGYAGEDFAKAYGGTDSGFYDYTLTLGLGYEINDMISVSGTMGYTDAIDNDVLPEQDVNLFGGASVAVAF